MKLQVWFYPLMLSMTLTACKSGSTTDSSSSPVASTDTTTTATTSGSSTTTSGSSTTTSGSSTTTSGSSTTTTSTGTSSTGVTSTSARDINGNALVSGQTYFLRNSTTKLCVDLQDGDTDDGAFVQSYDCSAGNANQIWMAEINSDGSVSFISTQSSKCLDLAADDIPQEANYYQAWTCSGAGNQSLSLSISAQGGYQLANMASLFQCLTDGGADGDEVLAYTCAGSTNQAYDLIPGDSSDPTGATRVTSSTVTTCSTANGANSVPAFNASQMSQYLIANPILVTTNSQCDAYCDAHDATTCAMGPDSSSGEYYCAPLSSSGVTSGSSGYFAVSCTSN